MPKSVITTGPFDDLRSRDLRFLQEAARFGEVTVLLWPDDMIRALTGAAPKFRFAERLYLLDAVRYVHRVLPLVASRRFGANLSPDDESRIPPDLPDPATLRQLGAEVWVDLPSEASSARQNFSHKHGLVYQGIDADQLAGFPELPPLPPTGRKKVVVTGCYDWLHSGHVRFFEEVSTYGELYVVAGHDDNIRLLKGEGHPLLPQAERRYQIASIRFVTQALISTGYGWLDAEPELQRLKPDIYAVNEEGDRGGKREYCAQNGIEYLVLKRVPAPGLPRRTSTELRGF